MSFTERHIVETYSGLFSGLSSGSKLELIKKLNKSIEDEKPDREVKFFKSFGAFASGKSPEELFAEIKAARKFKNKDIKF